jgi:hypothetical protein
MHVRDSNLNPPAPDKPQQPSRLAAKRALITLVLVALGLATLALAGNAPMPGQSRAFGKTLAGWQEIYMRWALGQVVIPPDANGNAVVGKVVLLPVPNTSGDGTPGHLDVTIHSGQAFTVPLLGLLGSSYTDGRPADPLVNVSWFQTTDLTLQIDGVTVVDNLNLMNYYSQFYFAPPVPVSSPPIASVIWCQNLGIVHNPLSVGTHTLKLDEKTTQALPPNLGGGLREYHNTITITVLP